MDTAALVARMRTVGSDLAAVEVKAAARSLESALGMNYQAVLRRLRKLIDAGAVERAYAVNDRRQRYRFVRNLHP